MTQVNGFQGFVGYSLRELNSDESTIYCSYRNDTQSILTLNQNRTNFTSDFMIRSYTSGCFYYEKSTGKWSSFGMDLYEDTNLEYTHCSSNHLTAFAGGLFLTPSTINYLYVFANATIIKNPTIYATVLFALCFYIVFAIWSRIKDNRDTKKMGIYVLKDNCPTDSYFYELIIFTGNRNESGTNSKVCLNFCNKSYFHTKKLF
jgi:polycystin 1L2